jgi:hypothetical protein
MNKFALILLPLLAVWNSHGAYIIDAYGTEEIVTPPIIAGTNLMIPAGDSVGGYRQIESINTSVYIGFPTSGLLQVVSPYSPFGSAGSVELTYSGSFPGVFNGLGHVDLTQGGINNGFSMNFTAANSSGGSLTIWLQNIAGVGSTATVPIPTSPGVLNVPFAAFQTDTDDGDTQPINFSDVGFIDLTLSLNNGVGNPDTA